MNGSGGDDDDDDEVEVEVGVGVGVGVDRVDRADVLDLAIGEIFLPRNV